MLKISINEGRKVAGSLFQMVPIKLEIWTMSYKNQIYVYESNCKHKIYTVYIFIPPHNQKAVNKRFSPAKIKTIKKWSVDD